MKSKNGKYDKNLTEIKCIILKRVCSPLSILSVSFKEESDTVPPRTSREGGSGRGAPRSECVGEAEGKKNTRKWNETKGEKKD